MDVLLFFKLVCFIKTMINKDLPFKLHIQTLPGILIRLFSKVIPNYIIESTSPPH